MEVTLGEFIAGLAFIAQAGGMLWGGFAAYSRLATRVAVLEKEVETYRQGGREMIELLKGQLK